MIDDDNGTGRVGLVLGSETPPTDIPDVAALAERLGFAELWAPEDCFFNGGIATAATALARTSRMRVGLGVLSGLARHPALLAMELATLASLYPGRVQPGVGLGAPAWVAQMGLTPPSQLTAMRETVTSLRSLLHGEALTVAGDVHSFDGVALTHLPDPAPAIYMGVMGPRMLHLSGEIADGTIASVMATAPYIAWLRDQVAAGQAVAGRAGEEHRVTTFALYRVDADGRRAKQEIRDVLAFYLYVAPKSALTDVYGVADELTDMHARGGDDPLALITRELPDQWVEDLTVAGDPDECAVKIQRLLDAGSDVVCLWPSPATGMREVLDLTAREVLPALAAGPVTP
jgi:alkanesulfonate monooxygenase SsuD/methylene tetrahydromethanopterin reductase-like flavin-dependent oxidoreductase (luciferase family)